MIQRAGAGQGTITSPLETSGPTRVTLELAFEDCIISSSATTDRETLKRWRIDDGTVLYVAAVTTRSPLALGEASAGDGAGSGRSGFETYFMDNDGAGAGCGPWQPTPEGPKQSASGIACLLSSLYVLTSKLQEDVALSTQVLHFLRAALNDFSPAVLALKLFLSRREPGLGAMAFLARALYQLSSEIAPPNMSTTTLFEQARVVLSFIVERARTFDGQASTVETFNHQSLVCMVTGDRISSEAVLVPSAAGGKYTVDKHVVETAVKEAPQNRQLYLQGVSSVEELLPDVRVNRLLLAQPSMMDALVWTSASLWRDLQRPPAAAAGAAAEEEEVVVAGGKGSGHTLGRPPLRYQWTMVQRSVRSTRFLSLVPALSLRSATTPCLTLDKDGRTSVLVSRGKDVGRSINLMMPLKRDTVTEDTTQLAAVLQASGNTVDGVDAMEERPCEEAIVVCLDVSESMRSKDTFNLDDQGNTIEDDGKDDLDAAWDNWTWAKLKKADDEDDDDDDEEENGDDEEEDDEEEDDEDNAKWIFVTVKLPEGKEKEMEDEFGMEDDQIGMEANATWKVGTCARSMFSRTPEDLIIHGSDHCCPAGSHLQKAPRKRNRRALCLQGSCSQTKAHGGVQLRELIRHGR